jgi:hypothetical protein
MGFGDLRLDLTPRSFNRSALMMRLFSILILGAGRVSVGLTICNVASLGMRTMANHISSLVHHRSNNIIAVSTHHAIETPKNPSIARHSGYA